MNSYFCFTIDCHYDYLHNHYTCYAFVVYQCDPRPDYVQGSKFYLSEFSFDSFISKFIFTVSKNHIDGLTRMDLKVLFYYPVYFQLDSMPSNVATFFPNIEIIVCASCGLWYIDAVDLEQYQHLTYLLLNNNHFTTLPGDLLKYSPNIVDLHLSGNEISSIGEGFFDAVPKLDTLDFSGNPCYNKSTLHTEIELLKRLIIRACTHQTEPLIRKKSERIHQLNNDTDVINKCEEQFLMMEEINDQNQSAKKSRPKKNGKKKGKKVKG